ncbi:aldo/keto reductase family protein [Paenibacillus flagellatus]|uniref:Aldo/keto reductase n=1 Tax=Paenibacillus flagellatus TaxID=2211139 RepID=A0A2V5JXW7_9BACL|nr:aldo/keto reductase family protein [Paenibacillus flagellatus]PYI51112.1 aldo/keto reductase [Paenibacillus flagellatus]
MLYRRLGGSGLKVSEISLGSWLTYGGYVEKQGAIDTIRKAYELGVNFYDTANVYMRGEAEKVVGEALRGYARESYVLATKVWGPMGDGPNDRGLSRKHIVEQCDASLRRLGLDYIDLYYCHSIDPDTPIEETLRAMDDLVRQGKVLYVGVSNWTAAMMAEAAHIADRRLLDRIVASQPPYSMLKRDIERDVIPVGAKYGIGQVVYSPLAQGVLSGKYKPGAEVPKDSRAGSERGGQAIQRYLTADNLERVERLRRIADGLGLTLSQLALAWVLREPNVSSAIIGASRPEQVEENAKASGVAIPADALEAIEAALQ